ncbi:hypothetical protein FNV43_RR12435 [Rhamnella rubrinervis]|uniref:Geranylgeranyl transferase type-2 subunit alpha n=1 Tax=Rhamnella rubrinervis TaxID=2594499 RepID=A0A8K0H8A8_9ROSA|nr:hypothetical protein FNV43_RR12435 [Rhamnella rubrinervis]
MPTNDGFQGVSNCYVFKSRLQEYAQKMGLPTPVYETIKEGPSHEPSFRSTVIVNGVRYDSLSGFFNRKAAEQSAAEVALVELSKSVDINRCISLPVHETGLCKNLLQEYAQKMNYAIPLYQCQKDENPGRAPRFSCTVEIGGIRYIGAAAKTKKEAEIKAARTALLAIQSSTSDKSIGDTPLTVIPSKKRGAEANVTTRDTSNVPKSKKPRFRKTKFKKKLSGVKVFQTRIENVQMLGLNVGNVEESKCENNNAFAISSKQLPTQPVTNSQDGKGQNEKVKYAVEGSLDSHTDGNSAIGLPTTPVLDTNGSKNGAVTVGTPTAVMSHGDGTLVSKNANEVSGCGELVKPVSNSSVDQLEASNMMHGRPRKSPKPEDEAASAAKAEKLRAFQSQFLSNHHNNNYTKEAIEVSAKLLQINPESYTAWNYRKLAVQHNLSHSNSDTDSVKSILDEELRVVESALSQNFKSYGAWHHRKWVLSKGHSSIDHELRLLNRFQKDDSRNFHAWNYRRFVAALMDRSEEEELNYTTDMINTNFSNYSAWHNRSVLLSHLLKRRVEGFFPKEKVLNDEYELVHQALFTDPDDQSGWFYYLWLLDQTVKADAPSIVSTWPVHGSYITLSGDKCVRDVALFSFYSFHSDSGTFPLILYFNEAVGGVNSSTVTVTSKLCTNSDLIWKPLSINNSSIAQVWVTYVKFLDKKLHCSENYTVEVSLGHSQGIISSRGFDYSHSTQIAFEVRVQCIEAELTKDQDQKISWKEGDFQNYETQCQEPNPVVSLNQLIINDCCEPTTSNWHAETVANEIALFRELLSEISCKIGKLTLARLLRADDAILSPSSNKMAHAEEILNLYSDLIKLDPSHSWFYKDEWSSVFLQQVTSNGESLMRHCYQYRDLLVPSIGNFICLRLNNLSLSRMGSFEKLLWIQMLDLSHNELRSIEGVEALQLLSCLNLSYNKLSSFTALGPLRLLKSLKVLDISCNEIGSHSIDTSRYLFSSPLSHTEEIEWNGDEIDTGNVNLTNYWEAFLAFKGLNLTQVDISGNAVADEQFMTFFVKLLPGVKWLDGERLRYDMSSVSDNLELFIGFLIL